MSVPARRPRGVRARILQPEDRSPGETRRFERHIVKIATEPASRAGPRKGMQGACAPRG